MVRVTAGLGWLSCDPYSKSLILTLSFGMKFKTEGKILGRWRVNRNFVFKVLALSAGFMLLVKLPQPQDIF